MDRLTRKWLEQKQDMDPVIQELLALGFLEEKDRTIWSMLLPERLKRLYDVVKKRTRYIAVVMEAVDDGHNQAAVLRSAEALGIQDVYVVSGKNPFKPNRMITKSAHKWLTIRQKPSIAVAIEDLHAGGYRVYASYLGPGAKPIDELDFSRPAALLFGNEQRGISEEAAALADGKFYLPMQGFVQSFNVSVAAALALYEATRRARELAKERYYLDSEEKKELFHQWMVSSLPSRVRKQIEG